MRRLLGGAAGAGNAGYTAMVVSQGGQMAGSLDFGATWEAVANPFGGSDINGIATDNNGTWVAVGDSGKIANSTNGGFSWTNRSNPFGGSNINKVASDGTDFIAVSDGGKMARSTNGGTSWSTVSDTFGSTNIMNIKHGNGVWMASGGHTAHFSRSTNGTSWSSIGTSGWDFFANPGAIANNGSSVWVIAGPPRDVGDEDSEFATGIQRSTNNGSSFGGQYNTEPHIPITGTGYTMFALAHGNGVMIMAGASGQLVRSTNDGSSFTGPISTPFGTSPLTSLIYSVDTDGLGTWIAVASDGKIARSVNNGSSWGSLISNPISGSNDIHDVAILRE